MRRGTSLRRSSYALSQGAGPGHLISSGTCIRSTAPPVDEKVTASNNQTNSQGQIYMKDNGDAPNGT